jgi:beta-N-acetylhexosaminidase
MNKTTFSSQIVQGSLMKKVIFLLSSLFASFSKIYGLNSTDLSLEQKIGQLFLVHFHGDIANEDAKILISKCHVGGFVLYNWCNNLSSPENVRNLTQTLSSLNSSYSEIPLFFAIDQEGGRVQRLKEGFMEIPSAQFLGDLDLPEVIYHLAKVQATELKIVGINVNFAPVVDINSNPNNPVIGNRSYSNDPRKVSEYARSFVRAYNELCVLSVIKHFPGHGDTKKDSHIAVPKLNKTLQQLKDLELKPFFDLKADVRGIMTAHIKLPFIDSEKVASASPFLIKDILRNSWGYDNLVISDSLFMQGIISTERSIQKAAISVLNAGSDILCLAGAALNEKSEDEHSVDSIIALHQYLVNATKRGLISEDEINKSVDRILKEKSRLQTFIEIDYAMLEDQKKIMSRELPLLHKINSFDQVVYDKIAKAIWSNETGMSKDKLLYWSTKEDFLSLGIGHFIWHPKNKKTHFEEMFPSLVKFALKNKIAVPNWISNSSCCPWETREDFIKDINSLKYVELRNWLEKNMWIQGKFLIQRLLHTIHEYLHSSLVVNKLQLLNTLDTLCLTPEGLYALVDYLNFKGSGLCEHERYNGEGWGLLQVLNKLNENNTTISTSEFVKAAHVVLKKRVQNSIEPEKEQAWINGWLSRVNRYTSL